ncbi:MULTISPECIES: ketopantoate reductase family protein [unclassified Meridianimarinicoccus]|uniref:ketopantoate reductase family protein n=1 Tax=unclassified Meridianimarinicoccus TaxID=2923344 RepID=UPI001867C738|nr:2-dehydropantoate 2-reductase [Fluviibacterium sp. MJW13]
MKILVMGAGALGGFYGARLARDGHEVTLVARGAHLDAMQRAGLRVESPLGDLHVTDFHATDRPEGNPDIVLLMVKNRDVEDAGAQVKPFLNDDSAVVTVQNGVSAPERLGRVIGAERVISGSVFMPASIKTPGVILHSSDNSLVRAGVRDGGPSDLCDRLIAALAATGVATERVEDTDKMLWEKMIFQSVFSAITTLTRLDIGPLRDCPETLALLRAGVEEAAAVGKAAGINLDADVAEVQFARLMEGLPRHSHASMLDDLNRGKPLELEYLSGEIVRLGLKHGISTPTHSFMQAALLPFAQGAPAAP